MHLRVVVGTLIVETFAKDQILGVVASALRLPRMCPGHLAAARRGVRCVRRRLHECYRRPRRGLYLAKCVSMTWRAILVFARPKLIHFTRASPCTGQHGCTG